MTKKFCYADIADAHINIGTSLITGREVLRLPWPHGTCVNIDLELKLLRETVVGSRNYGSQKDNLFSEQNDEKSSYSEQDCQSACLQRQIWLQCKCLDFKSRLSFPDVDRKLMCGALGDEAMERLLTDSDCLAERIFTPDCAYSHKIIHDLACVKEVTERFNEKRLSGESDCICPPQCYSYEYDLTIR